MANDSPIPTIDFNMPEPMTPAESLWRQHQTAKAPPTMQERIGSMVPQGAVPALAAAKKYAIDPFVALGEAGGQAGKQTADYLMNLETRMHGMTPEQTSKQFPNTMGIAEGAGEVIGSTAADPRNWPLMAGPGLARPLKALFTGQMGYGAYQSAEEAWKAHKEGRTQDAARLATQSLISGTLAGTTGLDAMYGEKSVPQEGPVPKPEPPAQDPVVPTPVSQGPRKAAVNYKPNEFQSTVGMSRFLDEVRKPQNQPDYSNWTPEEIQAHKKLGEIPESARGVSDQEVHDLDFRKDGVKYGKGTIGERNDLGAGYAEVSWAEIYPEYKGKGYAKDLYSQLGQMAKDKGFSTLVSDSVQSKEARLAWEGLVKKGQAEKITDTYGETRYKYNLPKEVGEPESTPTEALAEKPGETPDTPEGSGRPVQASEGPPLNNLWSDSQVKTVAQRFQSLDEKTIREAGGLSGEEANKRYNQALDDQDAALKRGASISDPDYVSANERASLYKNVEGARVNEATPSLGEKGVRKPGPDDPERGSLSLRPSVKNVVEANKGGVSGVLNDLFGIFDRTPESQTARNIMRRAEGERSRWIDQRHEEFESAAKEHDSDTISELIAFNNAGEGKPGASFLNPKDQAIATRFHDIYQNTLRPILQTINPDKFQGAGIENYLGRLFKKGGSQATAESMVLQRGPFEGSKAFSKHRAYDWIDESIAAGAIPITNNPIRMQTLVMNQIVKYISAHKAFDAFKEQGLTKFYRLGGNKVAESASGELRMEHPPQGWQRIDDSIFKPRYKAEGVGGLVEPGNYYMHPDAAKVFNNWLKPGLRGDWRYDTVRTVADTLNMTQLGFSAFHFTTTSLAGAATSDVSLGLQQLFRYGKPGKGIVSLAKGMTVVPSAIDTYMLGNKLEQEYLRPGTHPWLGKYADLVEEVNGGIGQGLAWDKNRMMDFKKMWGEDGLMSKGQAVLQKGLPAVAEWSSRWLMRYYVPRIKLGIFAKMAYEAHTELLDKGASRNEIDTEIGKIWNSVDNRAGQMRYKNMFWNGAMKDMAQIAVRSVGWTHGTEAELVGGAYDATKLLTGKGPLTQRTAYLIAAPMLAAGVGGAMHYMMTGQQPRKMEDYFWPGPDGRKLNIPTYVGRDMASWYHDPVKTAADKLNPVIQEFQQLLRNADFYDVEIRHTGDSALKQAGQVGKFLIKNNLPISVQAAKQQMARGDQGVKAVVASQLGFTPAPAWVGRSKFEERVYEMGKANWKMGPRTSEEYTRSTTVSALRAKKAAGNLSPDQLRDEYKKHTIRLSDIDKVLTDDEGTTVTERQFKGLGIRQQFAAMKEADDSEKSHYKSMLNFDQLEDLPDDEREILIREWNNMNK